MARERRGAAVITLWASTLLLAFVWSVVLFALAASARRRQGRAQGVQRQETGAVFAVAGLLAYVFAFANYFPGSPTNLRLPFVVLPGVDEQALEFEASQYLLMVVSLLYIVRMLIFFQLLPTGNLQGPARDDLLDFFNDLVAPLMAFLTLVVCATTLVSGLYSWTGWATLGCLLVILLGYFVRAHEYLKVWLSNITALLKGLALSIRKLLYSIPLTLIVLAVWLETHRPPPPVPSGVARTLTRWIERLDHEDLNSTQRERLRRLRRQVEDSQKRQKERQKAKEKSRGGTD